MSKFIDLDDLVYNINALVPHITPTQKEINIENTKVLKEKEGIEINQALVVSAVLQLETEGFGEIGLENVILSGENGLEIDIIVNEETISIP